MSLQRVKAKAWNSRSMHRASLLKLTLERDDFAKFGKWLNRIDIPVAVVLEGGYSNVLPELIDEFLSAWQS
jgi:acetoin utilization deacetylase AcuC-like enzyme